MTPCYLKQTRQDERAVDSDLPVTSSWTAINQPNSGQAYTSQTPRTPHTPRSSAVLNSTSHVETAAVKRKRRPTIARYLGMNSEVGLLYLDDPIEIPASPPAQVLPESVAPKSQRKRTRKLPGNGKPQDERRVSDELPVIKPTSSKQPKPKRTLKDNSVSKDALPDTPNPSTVSANVLVHDTGFLSQAPTYLSDLHLSLCTAPGTRTQSSPCNTSQKPSTKPSSFVSNTTKKVSLRRAEHSSSDGTVRALSSVHSLRDATEFFDDDIDEVLESIDLVGFTDNDLPIDDQVQNGLLVNSSTVQFDDDVYDDAFDDGLDDDALFRLITDPINNHADAKDRSHGLRSLSKLPLDLIGPKMNANQSDIVELTRSRDLAGHFVSPITGYTQTRTRDIDRDKLRKPIVRPTFPTQVQDRSPIIGLTPETLLRTCFRIGEAINTGRGAVRDGKNVILELYARILYSKRYNNKQSFVFCDLYHTNAPYISAEYDAAIWEGNHQFDYDSARLLQEMKMCRCVGKMEKKGKEWVLVISSVWEASWEDIEWVEGIVNS